MFCGEKLKQVKDMTPMEKIQIDSWRDELAWLRQTHAQLKNMNMASTGSFDHDEWIRKEIGDWGELSRGTVIAVVGETVTVVLQSGVSLKIECKHKQFDIDQPVTVRFLDGRATL